MKIGVFPEGLLSFDLGELVKLRFLSDDWKATLASLFPKSTEQAPRSKETDSYKTTNLNRYFGEFQRDLILSNS